MKDNEIIQKKIDELRKTEEEKEIKNEKFVLIQLKHHFARSTAIHFNLYKDRTQWRNAIIRQIDEKEKKVSLKEFLLGNLEYNFCDIDADSIREYFSKNQPREEKQ